MSPFKGIFLAACLLAGLLAAGPTRSAQAQRAATETALMDQSTPSQPPAQRSLLSVEKPANAGKPVGLAGPEQRIALVIGNSNYQNVSQLSNPANDAKSVAKLLNAAGFEVISATDLSHNEMIQVVQDFSSKIADRGPNTVAMVYYAGHGVQLAGENYLVPVDARISSETDLVSGSVRLVDVMATLDAIPSRLRIAILDACRNNPFPSLNEAGRGLAIVDAPNGSIVAYSTAPGSEALDGVGDHSPYTAAFLRLAHEKNLPIEQLFKRIRLDVNNSTGGQQTPWESSSLTSDFYFFGDTAVAATKAPAQEKAVYTADNLPSRASRAAYDYVLAENSIEHYQEFIQLYPHDPLCYRIRALLASLVQAKAWHNAVLANSPVAYQSFYDKFSSSPYAQSALKLAAQPKWFRFRSRRRSWCHLRSSSAMAVRSSRCGLPARTHLSGTVTHPSGTITRLTKTGAPQTTKLDGAAKHIDDRPTKSLSQSRISQRPARLSRSNFGMPPRRAGRNFSMASTQFHGSSFRPQFRSGGGGFGGGGFGGGGFGRR